MRPGTEEIRIECANSHVLVFSSGRNRLLIEVAVIMFGSPASAKVLESLSRLIRKPWCCKELITVCRTIRKIPLNWIKSRNCLHMDR